jgi:hypothetical protein
MDLVVFLYLVLCVVIAGICHRFVKTRWVYFLTASLVPPLLMVGGDSVWHGRISVWADIVFIVLCLIAFGISVVVHLVGYLLRRRKTSTTPK